MVYLLPISYNLSDIFTDLKLVWLEEKYHHVEEDELGWSQPCIWWLLWKKASLLQAGVPRQALDSCGGRWWVLELLELEVTTEYRTEEGDVFFWMAKLITYKTVPQLGWVSQVSSISYSHEISS